VPFCGKNKKKIFHENGNLAIPEKELLCLFLKMRTYEPFAQAGTVILLIASQVARVTGVSHQHLAHSSFCCAWPLQYIISAPSNSKLVGEIQHTYNKHTARSCNRH
jgi:hypothetical protein